MSQFDAEYEDILADRRSGSDLRWAAREWEETVIYKYRKKLNKKNLFLQVLKSDRVNHTIDKLVIAGETRKALENKVIAILEDMCHTLDTGVIRKFAITLPKIMKKIYGRILVNTAGIEVVKNVTAEAPVIFLPTHRSYADFLLISYIAFHYNLPFPVIAAGMDFMSMVIIGDMLRGAGAFYIRRSFMDDSLYWAVFQEYVQQLICDSGQPMEFFLEGTRSRSGKSLPPKLGLLGCVVECWLRGKVPDITIVPISISYNRTLEEKLYAYEMLGVPKPKESTSGLLKAMKILKENFGNIYVHIGPSLSVSSFMSPKVDRHLTVIPFHLSSLNGQDFDACEALALRVTQCLQKNCAVSIWSVACVSLLRCLWSGLWCLPFSLLLQETLVVAHLAERRGAMVEGIESRESVEDHLRRSLKEHRETALLSANEIVQIRVIHKENQELGQSKIKGFSLNASTVGPSVTHLLLQYYVNQLLHLFIRPILIVMAMQTSRESPLTHDQLLERFALLTSIFSFDFVFERQFVKEDFEEASLFLKEQGCIESRGDCFLVVRKERGGSYLCENKPLIEFLTDLIRPFLLNYQVALRVAESEPIWKNESSLVDAIQTSVEALASLHSLYSALSLDTCRQAVKMLLKMGALSKQKSSNGKMEFTSNPIILALKEVLQPSLLIPKDLRSKL